LNVSPKTIDSHRTSVMHKLSLKTNQQISLLALKYGLIAVSEVFP
jgi:DNA-binding CsgD family transcriptional regulator